MAINHYYYDQQIKRYIVQFMAVFAGLQVNVGKTDSREEGLIPVPIHYGYKDRVVASILADNTQNKPLRLPLMSAYLTGIEMAPERRKGIGTERRHTFVPRGGILPDDATVVRQYMPIPYNLTMELSIYTSNQEQKLQIMEQLLMLFDPTLQIQTNDAMFDWTKITVVELTGVRPEENYPSATDRRIIQNSLDFTVPIWIAAPAHLKQDFIKDVYMRLGVVDSAADGSYDIIAQLDDLGFDYEKVFTFDGIEDALDEG